MTIKALYPNIIPSLSLDFANVENLDPRITFARASTATYYNGVTTAKAEENLLVESQAYNNASWTNISTTETDNAATAPDGTSTAAILDDGTTTSGHDISGSVTITAGVTYTASAFFKNVDRQFVILACSTGINAWASTKFDLTAGTAGSTSTAGAGWSVTSSSITSVGNSWFRCTMTFVPGTTGFASFRLGMATDGTTFTAGQRGLESYTGTNATVEIWGAQFEVRSTATAYTPTTTQPITNYVPVLLSAANNVARFDHNPVTGESLGLLIEEQRTNLLVRSEEFQTTWTNERSSDQVNVIVSPAGTLTGTKLVEDTTATNTHLILQGLTGLASGSTLTFSTYVKAAERTSVRLQINDGSSLLNAVRANYDVSTGVASSVANDGTFTGANATITPVGNGWYRCAISGVATGVTAVQVRILLSSGGTTSYTGDGYSGIYIWGAQLEAGAFPTSYIATVASQVTRSADAASMTGANFSSWYNQAEGTLYAEASPQTSNALSYALIDVNNATASNRIGLFKLVTTGNASLVVQTSGTTVVLTNSGAWTASGKFVGAYAVDNFASVLNGGAAATDTSGTLPVVTQATIGARGDGGNQLTGTIKKLAYYPKALTAAELQALTQI
jgi:hypothetical protein